MAVRAGLFGVAWTLLFLAGCTVTDIETAYGRRRGTPGAESVAGTAVLAELFEQAGHRVTGWRRLSPKLQECQTIVWFPDDFKPPAPEQRAFLERWLSDQPGRTLVYVGRDFDAASTYWRSIQPAVPAVQANEVARRLALSQATHDRQRAAMPNGESCDWFVVRRDARQYRPTALSGAWAAGIDPQKAEIQLGGRLERPARKDLQEWERRDGYRWVGPPDYEDLLSSQTDPLVTRITWNNGQDGQLLLVTNGSFLLNLPLVNHEHRKLARRLVDACGSPGRTVFLESGAGGPEVYATEPGAAAPTGFEIFTVWPMGVILIHLTALGILACVALFPIFGRPRQLPARTTADFGQHVEALGELLRQTGDREYALQRLAVYQEQVRRDTGHGGKTATARAATSPGTVPPSPPP